MKESLTFFLAADGQIFGTGQRPSEGNDSILDREWRVTDTLDKCVYFWPSHS